MKNKAILLTTTLAAALALTGCQSGGGSSSYGKYVTLGEYKGLTVDRSITTITDDDIQEEIQNELLYSNDPVEITDRPAAAGDTVNIDFEGTVDGEPFEGGSAEDFEYELGNDDMIEGFDEQITGMSIGDSKEFDITFPEPYDGTMDGKTATFTVTLNAIYELEIPEYNDAYVKENYDYDTTEEYEEYLKGELQSTYDEDANYMALAEALSTIVESSTFSGYPEEMYNTCKAQIEEENTSFAEALGADVDDLLGEDYDIDLETLAVVNERLVVYAIAEKEKLKITDEEIQTFAEGNYELYELESVDEFIEAYGKENLEYDLLYDKVLDFLSDNITFNDVTDVEEVEDEEDLIDLNELLGNDVFEAELDTDADEAETAEADETEQTTEEDTASSETEA